MAPHLKVRGEFDQMQKRKQGKNRSESQVQSKMGDFMLVLDVNILLGRSWVKIYKCTNFLTCTINYCKLHGKGILMNSRGHSLAVSVTNLFLNA